MFSLMEYDVALIEAKWQDYWEREKTFYTSEDSERPKYYNLQMYPYPSGDLHMGHLRNYTYVDLLTRYRRMQGYNVLSPMGWDSFGLPAENAAIATGVHPREYTERQINRMKVQLRRLGAVYDWSRELACHTPEYYRWDQWLFLKLYEQGLAYKSRSAVNWCEQDQTVLANEQVVNGACERCESPVVRRDLEQWHFRITSYADRLLEDLGGLDWPERVKLMQENWIGRSEGCDFTIEVADGDGEFEVYTTRPDTIYGMTFAVLAPEHPLVEKLVAGGAYEEEIRAYVERVSAASELERMATGEKSGIFIGRYCINPANGKLVPLYIADYVLMGYGTGAIMGVPGEDQRDWEFAAERGLEIIRTVQPPDGFEGEAYAGDGVSINSDFLNGLETAAAKERIIAWLEERGIGRRAVKYRLHDWLVSRQRYWGCPIPMVNCESCGLVPVPEEDLPVIHPDVEEYRPKGQSPLALATDWVEVDCPQCGGPGRRETDTMDTFVDSSWYFLRYCDAHNSERIFDGEKVRYWMAVDQYIGGVEHAVLHLLYARFITKVLYDLGLCPAEEPFTRLFTQGMLVKDGAKMSKSRGNVVTPEPYYERYGADAVRLYELFIGPPTDDAVWIDGGVEGTARFLDRVWRLGMGKVGSVTDREEDRRDKAILGVAHRALRKVTSDIDRFHFNTVVSTLMALINEVIAYLRGDGRTETFREVYRLLLLMLAPLAPHVSHELWERLGYEGILATRQWPAWDLELAREDKVVMVLQVNGKVRDRVEVPTDIDEATAEQYAFRSERIQRWLEGGQVTRVIARPPRVVNVVVS